MSTCVARYGKALTADPVVMRSGPATGHIRCALLAIINPNSLNLLSWLLAYLSDK